MRKAAKGFRDNDDVVFAVASKTDFAGELDKWGVGGRDQGVAVEKDGIRFRMEEDEFSPAAITAFVNAFLAGEVEAYVKSEPIPEQKPGVQVVVGKNFEEIVLDDSKDVLLEMYAPWCGHCKKLEPVYNELGAHYKDATNLVIAKMDATANDSPSPHFQARG